VRERCYDFLDSEALTKAENLLLNKGSSGDRDALEKLGVWSRGNFVSAFLTSEVFLRMNIPRSTQEILLDDTLKTPYAQQVISAGLRDMTEEDFKDAHYNVTAVENAVGFRWGFNVMATLGEVWTAPQPRTQYDEVKGPGRKPVIDFFFNGRLNMGVELALNVGVTVLEEHLNRFDGRYGRYKRHGVVFHLDTNSDKPLLVSKDNNNVYTFLKKKNALYRGSNLVQSNAVRRLPSPPPLTPASKSYSTFAMSCLRVVAKGMK